MIEIAKLLKDKLVGYKAGIEKERGKECDYGRYFHNISLLQIPLFNRNVIENAVSMVLFTFVVSTRRH